MDDNIVDKVEETLSKIKSSLGGADVKLKEVNDGVVIVQYYKSLTNPSCHTNKTHTTRELVAELLDDGLREVVPDFKEVIVLENE